ncbi:MAG: 23S rRNA (adenine(2503)-C(2))-methyltransferase RlmN [Candidatus Buchananbacteria bacterium]
MDFAKLKKSLSPYPAFRLKQVNFAIFKNLVESWDEVTNLPKDILALLKAEISLEICAKIQKSTDQKTIKAAVTLADGQIIETVLMRHGNGRNTVCVSSQAGCPLACEFCATGKLGFKRILTSFEIISQVLLFSRLLKTESERVDSIVFMGMGEPFLNYDEVLKAIRILNDNDKFGIGARHISISTAGIVEGIKKFSQENLQVNLALSLHAPNDQLRSRLMPINQQYPIKKVLTALADYIKISNRRVMIEYLMLKDVNDSPSQATELAILLKRQLKRLFFVNLITYNETGCFEPSKPETIKKFKSILEKEGITVIQRYRFGADIDGACGQLAAKLKNN